MRLGQLARKLAIKPGELVSFLEKNNIPVESGSNTRLADDQVRWIVNELAPDKLDLILESSEQETVETSEGETEMIVEVETENNNVEETAPITEIENITEEEESPSVEIVEVIRAPKVELPGLRIVGKIDLPEPKKKEAETSEDGEQPGKLEPRRRGEQRVRRNDNRYPRKNSVAQQRERDEREARRQKALEEKKKKQRKTENYQKKVSAVGKPKAKKTKKTFATEQPIRQTNEQPRSFMGKLKRWLFRE